MITSISIENFRCFNQSRLKGFSQINLIGGLNNAGKSALLEAILLTLSPQSESFKLINKYRNELVTEINPMTKTWDYLFHNAKKSSPIIFKTHYNNGKHDYSLSIKKNESNDFHNSSFYEKLYNNKEMKEALDDFELYTHNKNIIHSLDLYLNDENHQNTFIGAISYTSTSELNIVEAPHYIFNQVAYRPSKQMLSNEQVAKLLDTAINKGAFNDILNTIKIIDESINDIRVIDQKVFLTRDRVDYLPIGMFGDAVTSTLFMILTLYSLDDSSYLLIDEVENGIHHSKHFNFLKHISKLAIRRNIQVFMTTHSSEFIKCFNDFSLKQENTSFSYIELARTRNNQIIGNVLDPEILDLKIKNSKNYRGE